MNDKIPFGFRPDIEEKPEPKEDEKKQEISCTSLHESKVWTRVVETPASPNDGARRHW